MVLFFFEFGIFALAVGAILLAETVGRQVALTAWGLVTLGSLLAQALVTRQFGRAAPQDDQHARWREAVRDGWRHFTVLLFLGVVALLMWWRLVP